MTSVATIAAASITFLAFAADPILIGVPYRHGNTSQASVDLVRNNPDKYRNITDVQFPVQDWTPIIQAQKAADCGVIMIDHWVAAELASFALADVLGLTPGAPVYLQYGPAQPEFLDLAGDAAEGFVWGSVIGTYADEMGMAFRQACMAKYPGTMGMVYSGSGHDTTHMLACVRATVDPSDFDGVGAAIKAISHRGVCGTYTFANDGHIPLSYPNTTGDPEAGQAHLIVQVQDGAHTIISPTLLKQTAIRPEPWM